MGCSGCPQQGPCLQPLSAPSRTRCHHPWTRPPLPCAPQRVCHSVGMASWASPPRAAPRFVPSPPRPRHLLQAEPRFFKLCCHQLEQLFFLTALVSGPCLSSPSPAQGLVPPAGHGSGSRWLHVTGLWPGTNALSGWVGAGGQP